MIALGASVVGVVPLWLLIVVVNSFRVMQIGDRLSLNNIGLSIAILAGLGLLAVAVIAARAAVRGKQAAWMAQAIFSLSGAILIGTGLIAMSVSIELAWAMGVGMAVLGLAVVGYAFAKFRVRRTG